MQTKTLICSAIETETSILKEQNVHHHLIKPLGIGFLEAAIHLSEIVLQDSSIKQVVFVGTCGAYQNSGLKNFDIVQTHDHCLVGSASYLNAAYFPEAMIQQIRSKPAISCVLPSVKSATVLEITKSNELAANIAIKTQASVEQMELFGLARFAQRHSLPFTSFLIVTNLVGRNSHEEWQKNHLEAERCLQNYILDHKII
jgi:nucleoside phosphorylase